MTKENKIFRMILWIFISAQIVLFVYFNLRPIYWLHNEILLQGFFWSMDGIDKFTLHRGLNLSDWIKPFQSHYVDGIFRTRQLSYLLEMLSFKFWQYWGVGFIRNYTLIGLHLINVFLLGCLVFLLTRSKRWGCLAAGLFLNAGVSLATLIFPFRNAKLLVMTFFLLAWVILAQTKTVFAKVSPLRRAGFYLAVISMVFTDELGYFLSLALICLIYLKDQGESLHDRRIQKEMGGVLILCISLGMLFFQIYALLKGTLGKTVQYSHYGHELLGYLTNFQTLTDSLLAFFTYFLRYNFGYWDNTGLGIFSLISFLGIAGLAFYRSRQNIFGPVLILLALLIGLKAVFLPHNSGVHPIFMPEGTKFPSLLFFSFYYTYFDALLLCLMIILGLSVYDKSWKIYGLVCVFIMVISLSNATHLKDGPPDTLKFHQWDDPERLEIVKSILKTKKFLNAVKRKPAYLSFPAGPHELFQGRIDDGYAFIYARIVPIMFLKEYDEGQALISFKNIKPFYQYENNNELSVSKDFWDVGTGVYYDLEAIRKVLGKNSMKADPADEKRMLIKDFTVKEKKKQSILFFIKGDSDFALVINDESFVGKQFYGQSYQYFEYNLNLGKINFPAKISLRVLPKKPNNAAYLVGPFLIDASDKKLNNKEGIQ